MKIVFLCGSLEPGKDGVGDYTRKLAVELIKRGHEVVAVGLNDNQLRIELEEIQQSDNISLSVFRLPAAYPYRKSFPLAKAWIDHFNPDWISLQFVPFSFHKKGLPFGLNKLLIKLGENRRWHMMFHELWVGMEKESTLKKRLWGRLQRLLIRLLIVNMKPKVIHTQCLLYQQHLSAMKFESCYLPLFSNIPSNKTFCSCKSVITDKVLSNSKRKISFVVFGTIHAGAPIEVFATEAAAYTKEENLEIELIMIGRNGKEQVRWINVWESAGLACKVVGEKSPDEVSLVLSQMTIGIVTTAFAIADKSGSFAAMREHFLPVVCLCQKWTPIGIKKVQAPQGVVQYKYGSFKNIIHQHGTIDNKNTVNDVCRKLIYTLESIE